MWFSVFVIFEFWQEHSSMKQVWELDSKAPPLTSPFTVTIDVGKESYSTVRALCEVTTVSRISLLSMATDLVLNFFSDRWRYEWSVLSDSPQIKAMLHWRRGGSKWSQLKQNLFFVRRKSVIASVKTSLHFAQAYSVCSYPQQKQISLYSVPD